MDVIGVQQVLSLSSTAEKVQQTTQQRGDIVNFNAVTSKEEEDEEKSNANPPAEGTQEARFHREKENRGEGKKRAKVVKKRLDDEEEAASKEALPTSESGNVLDVVA